MAPARDAATKGGEGGIAEPSDAGYAGAHVALREIYAVRADYAAAWRHAREAAAKGAG